MNSFSSFITEIFAHYVILVCVLGYFVTIFSVLKAFQYNKDKFEE